jgi:hypothetical protein
MTIALGVLGIIAGACLVWVFGFWLSLRVVGPALRRNIQGHHDETTRKYEEDNQ